MKAKIASFFERHPVLRQVLWWSLPALAFGAALRFLMLTYLPYAYWGSDSKSYYSFAFKLLSAGDISLDSKRRYLYPLFMLPVSILPGSPLKWLAWIQHAAGLAAVLPLAYAVRKTFRFWQWSIIPVTLIYASLPVFLWYEHELLGEAVFFSALLWMFGGWTAWTTQADPARARRMFWFFFVPLAVFLLIKPSGRFLLPGLVIGMVTVAAWRRLSWRSAVALLALFAATLTVGSKKQGAWLLYVASFPLTQLDTPAHADYKRELRPIVEPYARDFDAYHYLVQRGVGEVPAPFDFLETPSEEKAPPLWAALDRDDEKKRELYMSLAMEGIKARPWDFVYLGVQRFVASANISDFDLERFDSGYFPGRLKNAYEDARKALEEKKPSMISLALGYSSKGPLPPFEEMKARLAPAPGSSPEQTLLAWVGVAQRYVDVVARPRVAKDAPAAERSVLRARPTVLGWWLLGSLVLALVYWRTLGVWTLAMLGYFAGVFLVSLVQARYFAPAWLIFPMVMMAPLDLLACLFVRRKAE